MSNHTGDEVPANRSQHKRTAQTLQLLCAIDKADPVLMGAMGAVSTLAEVRREADVLQKIAVAVADAAPERADLRRWLQRALKNAPTLAQLHDDLGKELKGVTDRHLEDLLSRASLPVPPDVGSQVERVAKYETHRVVRGRLRSWLVKALPHEHPEVWLEDRREEQATWCAERALNAGMKEVLLADGGPAEGELSRAWAKRDEERREWQKQFPGSEGEPPTLLPRKGDTRISISPRFLEPRLRQLLQPSGPTDNWLPMSTWEQAQRLLTTEARRVAAPLGLLEPASRAALLRAQVVIWSAGRERVFGTVWNGVVSAAQACPEDASHERWAAALVPCLETSARAYALAVSRAEVLSLHTAAEPPRAPAEAPAEREMPTEPVPDALYLRMRGYVRRYGSAREAEVLDTSERRWYPKVLTVEQLTGTVHDISLPSSLVDLDARLARLASDAIRDLHRPYRVRPAVRVIRDEDEEESTSRPQKPRKPTDQARASNTWKVLDEWHQLADKHTLSPNGQRGITHWPSLLEQNPVLALEKWRQALATRASLDAYATEEQIQEASQSQIDGAEMAIRFLKWVNGRLLEGAKLPHNADQPWLVLDTWLNEEYPDAMFAESPGTADARRKRRSRWRNDVAGNVIWALDFLLPRLLADAATGGLLDDYTSHQRPQGDQEGPAL